MVCKIFIDLNDYEIEYGKKLVDIMTWKICKREYKRPKAVFKN